jgi:DUF971 family protein
MTLRPTTIERAGPQRLRISWSDGQVREYAAAQLRGACPCATCREKRRAPEPPPTALPILQPGETAPIDVAQMTPVGNYAYSIQFSDGHDTGIFTFELLRELGEERL